MSSGRQLVCIILTQTPDPYMFDLLPLLNSKTKTFTRTFWHRIWCVTNLDTARVNTWSGRVGVLRGRWEVARYAIGRSVLRFTNYDPPSSPRVIRDVLRFSFPTHRSAAGATVTGFLRTRDAAAAEAADMWAMTFTEDLNTAHAYNIIMLHAHRGRGERLHNAPTFFAAVPITVCCPGKDATAAGSCYYCTGSVHAKFVTIGRRGTRQCVGLGHTIWSESWFKKIALTYWEKYRGVVND